jgi:glycosyltransferase involved in cell wall biosynthesis
MRILFLSQHFPHERVVSGTINVYQRIRLLAERGHEIGLAGFIRSDETALIPAVRPLLYEMELLPPPPPPRSPRQLAACWLSRFPREFQRTRSPRLQHTVGRMVERARYDVVIAEFVTMGQYVYGNPFLPAVRRVISSHSCLTTALKREIQLRPYSFRAFWNWVQLPPVQSYEFRMYRSADLVLTLTAEQRQDLLQYDPDLRIGVVPYGVDAAHLHLRSDQRAEDCIVFTGYFAQEPNRDAFFWFLRQIWPRVRARHPQLKFYAVGAGATAAMQKEARRDPQVMVTGYVHEVADYLARARLYVCPIRYGTGFRGKILQAMATGVPVVSTALAAEGIPAQTGHDILLADTPHTMAEGIELLLRDAGLRRSLAANARLMVLRRFTWSRCVDLLEQLLYELMPQRKKRAT